jgi:flagellar protein FlbD
MIHLTRINHSSLILNSDLIEHLQATPDTLVTLTNGHTYLVLETPEEIIHKIAVYRHECLTGVTRPSIQDCNHA